MVYQYLRICPDAVVFCQLITGSTPFCHLQVIWITLSSKRMHKVVISKLKWRECWKDNEHHHTYKERVTNLKHFLVRTWCLYKSLFSMRHDINSKILQDICLKWASAIDSITSWQWQCEKESRWKNGQNWKNIFSVSRISLLCQKT